MAEKVFRVDANTVLTIGRNSIKDATTAVVELIKNSYDADAETVEVELNGRSVRGGFIRISDNGHGMADADIVDNWLRIGYSEKVTSTTSGEYKRRKTGEKGIGRLSADRLGATLELRTKKKRHQAAGLLVDWNRFEERNQEISNIVIPEIDDPIPTVPRKRRGLSAGSGTELIIRRLRQRWTNEDIAKLHSELELLLPPYTELAKNFSLKFTNDVNPEFNGEIRYSGRARGEIDLSASIDSKGTLQYQLSYYSANDRTKRKLEKKTLPWSKVAPDPSDATAGLEPFTLGSFQVRLSYFVRRSDFLEGTGLSLRDLRTFLQRNAGVRIYRDLVRVKPYGDPSSPESDWLGLGERKIKNPAGAGRSSFKIAPNQLVGAVFTGRDVTPELIDSSAREGLVENDAFRQLRVVLMRCITQIESKYHEVTKERPASGEKTSRAQAAVKELAGSLSTLTIDLEDLRDRLPPDLDATFSAVQQQLQAVIAKAGSAQKDIEDIADQTTVYRGLATVGIASAIFGHETAYSVSQAAGCVTFAKTVLERTPPNVEKAVARLAEAEEYMDRVASWGKFALTRVNKDKRQRRRVSVTLLVNKVLDELAGPMAKSEVVLKRAVEAGVEARTFAMDIEVILINFLTNAYHELKRHQTERNIRVRLSEKKTGSVDGFEISVSDSGGGISPEHIDSIWEPLFSTKTDERGRANGTGLGLSIVKSAVEELDGSVQVKAQGPLGGATFSAWLPRGF